MEEGIARQAIGATPAGRRIISSGGAVAANHIVARITGMRWVGDSKLRVVEDVEALGAKLDVALAKNLEVFQDRKIEIGAAGIVQRIAPAAPERQSARSDVSSWVGEKRPESLCCLESSLVGKPTMRIADTICVGTRPKIVSYATVVGNSDSPRASAIDNAKRGAALEGDNSRQLPTIQQSSRKRGIPAIPAIVLRDLIGGIVVKHMRVAIQDSANGQVVDEAQAEAVTLVEIRAGLVAG